MSLFSRRMFGISSAGELIPPRPTARRGAVAVTNETAMRHSAVWACIRLRANLISTLPVDAFRKVGARQIEIPKPKILTNPGGERVDILEWLYSTQSDLDRAGNCFGLITETTSRGLPNRIDLVPLSDVVVEVRDGEIDKYRIGGKRFDPSEVWHERQYTVAGLHVGLSPIAHAAWSIGEYLSVQDFALDWFSGNAVPAAHLKNTAKTISAQEAATVKQRFHTQVENGGLFVTGNDWDYEMIQANASDQSWIQAKQFGIGDIARFFDCPGDLIDAVVTSGSITYANIVQRHLQLLIMHLGPAIIRREAALTRTLASPRFVKLNSDALLRMDPKTRAETFDLQIKSRILAPSEARELDDRQPFTEAQMAEFDRLFGRPKTEPTTSKTGVTNA